MVNEDLLYLMFLKYNILNNDYKQVLNITFEENNGENVLNNILLLLEKEPSFVYFDEKIFDYLYNLNSDIRYKCKSEEISRKSAEIVRKLNMLKGENIKEKRSEFFRDQWYLRMGEREYFDQALCNIRSDDFKKLFNHDTVLMMNLAADCPLFISNNNLLYLSSISYLSSNYSDMLDDEIIETLLLVLSNVEITIKEFYKRKELSNFEYDSLKRVIKNIHNNFKGYYKRNKNKKIKKIVLTIEN